MKEEKVKAFFEDVLGRLERGEGELTVSPYPEERFIVKEEELAYDLKAFADDVFEAESTVIANTLRLTFKNGQVFSILIKEEIEPNE